MLKRFIDEKPDPDTDVLVSFMGTFDNKSFSFSNLEAYTYMSAGYGIPDSFTKDHLHTFDYDFVVEGDAVLVHPKADYHPLTQLDDLCNLYWIYQRDAIRLLTQ